MKQKQMTKRFVSLLVAVMFLSEMPAPFAAAETGNPVPPAHVAASQKPVSADDIFVPENYGFVKARFKGTSGKMLLYIEDIHANREVQENIANIIRHVRNTTAREGLRLIAVEGAQGRIDPSLLKSCPDRAAKEKIAGILLGEGYISGAELYATVDDAPVLLYGIERGDLYAKNLKNFIRVQRIREKGSRYLDLLRDAFQEIGERVYPAEVKPLVHMRQQQESGAVSFTAFAAFLNAFYLKHKDAHPEIAGYYAGLRDFQAFMAVMSLEKKFDPTKVEIQRQEFIKTVSASLRKEEIAELVKMSLLFRTGRVSGNDFYSFLKGLAREKRIGLSRWPDLDCYIGMTELYARIDAGNLFEEAELLARMLQVSFLKTREQKEIDRCLRDIGILEKMITLRMTRKDIEYYSVHRSDFTQGRFSSVLAKYPPARIEHSDEYLDLIFTAVTYVEGFYDTALARDEALFRNVVKKLRDEKSGFGVLVTGGFHTEGVKKRLEREGISYIVVSPRVAQSKDSSVYLQRMMEVSPPFARYLFRPEHLAVEVLNAVQPITGRGEKNKEYLNVKEVMLALSLMLAGSEKGKQLLPDEIRRFFFEKQAQWMLQFKRLKNSESSDADIISFEDVDRDFKRLAGVFSNIRFDYGGIRWIGDTLYVPFRVDSGGTKKSAVFAVGRRTKIAAQAAIEGGSVDKDAHYEIIDEREFYARIENGGAGCAQAAAARLKDDLSREGYSGHFRLHDAADAVSYLRKKSADPAVNRILDFILEHHVLKDAADLDPFTLSVTDISRIISRKYPSDPIISVFRDLSPDQADLIAHALRLPALTINDMMFDALEGESRPLVRRMMREMNRLRAIDGVHVDYTPDVLRQVFAGAKGRIYGLQGVGGLGDKTELFYEREIMVRLVLEGVKRLDRCGMIVEAGASAGEGYYVHRDIRRTSDYDLEVIFEEKGLADKTAHLKKVKETIARMIAGGMFSNGDRFEDLLTMYVFGDRVFSDPSALRGTSEWRELGSLPMLAPKLHLHYSLWSNRVLYSRPGTAARVPDVGELAFDARENRLEGHEYVAYQLEALSKAYIDGNTKPLIKLGLRAVLGAIVSDDGLLSDFQNENPRMEPGCDGTYQYSEMIYRLAKKGGKIFSAEELELIEWLFYGKVGKNAGITENSREKVAMIERLIYKLFIMTQTEYPAALAALEDPAEREMREKAYLKKLEYIMEVTVLRIERARTKNAGAAADEYAGYLDALSRIKKSILLNKLKGQGPHPVAVQPSQPKTISLEATGGILVPLWHACAHGLVSAAKALSETIGQAGSVFRKQVVSSALTYALSCFLFFIPPHVDAGCYILTELTQFAGKPCAAVPGPAKHGIDEIYFNAVIAGMDDAAAAQLYERVSRLPLSDDLARDMKVVRELIRFEQSYYPGKNVGACLKSKMVFSRYAALLRRVETLHPGFCADVQEKQSQKLDKQ